MKRKFSISLVVTGLILAFGLTNCKKEQNAAPQNDATTELSAQQAYASISSATGDRIDAIVKDLALSSYSLSFDKPIASAGIIRTSYGAESSYSLVDPQDLICPDLFRKIHKLVPFPKWPTFIPKTCPTMIPNLDIAKSLQQFLAQADPIQFKGLQGIKTYNGNILLANENFKRQFATLQNDKIDELLKGLDPEKFVLMNHPSGSNGILARDFYGYADLNKFVFTPYNKTLRNIIVYPKIIGCFDPIVLKIIRERLQEVSPALTKKLGVTPLADAKNVAVLSF